MSRVTIKGINKKLPEGYEIIRDRPADCFYFLYPENVTWYESCIYTNLLSERTIDEWINLFNEMREESEHEIHHSTENHPIKLCYHSLKV